MKLDKEVIDDRVGWMQGNWWYLRESPGWQSQARGVLWDLRRANGEIIFRGVAANELDAKRKELWRICAADRK